MRLLSHMLGRFVRDGTLRVIDAHGNTHSFGAGVPVVTMRLNRYGIVFSQRGGIQSLQS